MPDLSLGDEERKSLEREILDLLMRLGPSTRSRVEKELGHASPSGRLEITLYDMAARGLVQLEGKSMSDLRWRITDAGRTA